MEAVSNGVEDKLVDGLSFKLAPGASYVTNRRSVSFHPQTGNVYESGTGARLIRIALNGDDWLDPSTLRICMDVVNTDSSGKSLRVLGGPHSFFRRCRLLAGGTVIEDIDNFATVSQMLELFKSKHSRQNQQSEGFGQEWSEHRFLETYLKPLTHTAGGAVATFQSARDLRNETYQGILSGQSQRVLFKPQLGLFHQPKFLPLRYCPLVLELELVSDATEPILSTVYVDTATDNINANGNGSLTTFNDSNTAKKWRIQNVEIKCDVITLDNSLDNSYASHLMSGKSLPINYNTFVSQMQTITGNQKPIVNVTRAMTRLKSVFVSLQKDGIEGILTPGAKQWRSFHSPMSYENANIANGAIDGSTFKHHEDGEFNLQFQIGSKLYPEYPMRSHSEAFYQLVKTLGIQSSDIHSFDINGRQYRDRRFIAGIDLEKVLDAGYTGLNTRAGDLMSIRFEFKTSEAARLADRMHIVLHSDQIMEIKDSGVQVFD